MHSRKVIFSDTKYSAGRERVQPFKTRMLELVKEQRPGRILDIGCGSGVISGMLKEMGWEVHGLDISPVGVGSYCSNGFSGLLGDAEEGLPFKDRSFDAVWLSEVIEHLVDYGRLLQEIGRVLKEEGRAYVTAPNSAFYAYRLLYLLGKCPTELQHPYHVRFFSPGFLCREMAENGFLVEKSVGHNVYAAVPRSLFDPNRSWPRSIFYRILRAVGFEETEGLIHGDKLLLHRFSTFLPSFFSNAIMIVARKPYALSV